MSFETVISVITDWVYPALLVLFFFGFTIFFHELGHFLMARRRGMKIERFSVGFGSKIWGYKKKGVEYQVGWIPFGGYVALPQMSPMEAIEGSDGSSDGGLPRATPTSKILVALAGPAMNVLLAFVLACIIWQAGKPSNPSVIGWVEAGSLEEQKGIQPGDRIVQVNDQKVQSWGQLVEAVAFSLEPDVNVIVERNGKRLEFNLETKLNEEFHVKTLDGLYPRVRPYAREVLPDSAAEKAGMLPGDRFVSVSGVAIYSSDQLRELVGKRADEPTEVKMFRDGKTVVLTVVPRVDPEEKAARMGVKLGDEMEIIRPGPTPGEQFEEVFASMWHMAKALRHSKETGVGVHSVSGPVGIFAAWWYGIVSNGVRQGLVIAVLLNINLAIINLFPLPILDGGHIVFALVEGAMRKPLNARIVQTVSTAFAVLLISFMLYITFFDVQRFFGRSRVTDKPPANDVIVPAAKPASQP